MCFLEIEFPIPTNGNHSSIYIFTVPHLRSITFSWFKRKRKISRIFDRVARSFVFVPREGGEKRERETLEDGWPATIFLTRGERFDRRMAEGGSFSIPAPGVFARLRYLSSLFHPVLAPFVLPFVTFHIFRPLSRASPLFAKRRSAPPVFPAKLIGAVFLRHENATRKGDQPLKIPESVPACRWLTAYPTSQPLNRPTIPGDVGRWCWRILDNL